MLSALAVVLVLLVTSGWTAVRDRHPEPGTRTAALLAWRDGRIGGRPLPAPDAAPRLVARFFRGLTGTQQDRLAARHPLVVGNLDGVPVALRYRANRIALARARAAEHRRTTDERLTEEGRHEATRRMHRFASLMRAGRRILAFDPTGRGRAVEVLGDLERAQRVSVVVPGADTELLTFERTHRRYSAPVGMARALHHRERATAPRVRTATVAWADYTAPRGVGVDAASGELAAAGARRLVSFLESLPGRSTVALFCHSYGSVVCGMAAGGREERLPGRVTDITVAGSPGMRADRADELETGARIWAMRSEGDWIADVPYLELGGLGHGADPLSPAFGAHRLAADGATGHTGYFEPGTGSLANMAAVGTGAYHRVDEL
ncbi:alpha/beta hydrolase [Streptomyces sp. DH37]|uniref:alpha/beta hydrolase n=1 Tax=Streptomyces sp. DH37 TaxID=3040122 RepID=UPI0024433FAC|nr:alpha/beta hydrolase [Streptomyces sp. DH37]MDG9701798.1 alpha/beta hydrolase [Streptomyces sp. DH37]